MRSDIVLRSGWEIIRLSKYHGDLQSIVDGSEVDAAYPATVPTGVLEVLLEHGEISDPRIGDNAASSAWIGDEDWVYRLRFETPAGIGDTALLTFLGVDTIADAYLNGERIQSFDNMFREWTVDATGRLAPEGQSNILAVVITSPARYVEAITTPEEHAGRIAPCLYLRKGAGDFSSYLGSRPRSLKVGLHRDVVLTVPGPSWIDDLRVTTASVHETEATIEVNTTVGGRAVERLSWTLAAPEGETMASGEVPASEGSWTITVENPRIWWPRTHGESPLYLLKVRLVDESGETLDSRDANIGLRTVELVTVDPGSGEDRFQFVVNGQPIFLKGACWANVEGITSVWSPERAARLYELVEHADMNVLRVWGGGLVPEDDFYDECDRRGILIWQDFMFEYNIYPSDQPAWVETVEAELAGQVRRLRNHPSIFIWVGGNESHMGWDFRFGGDPELGNELFAEIMPRIVGTNDGTRPFHANSPYGGQVANWPLEGDWHDYTTVTYSHRASVPLFVSETGRVSAPSLASMRKFLSPEQLWPTGHDGSIRRPGEESWPPMWGYRAPDGAWEKIGPIHSYLEPTGPGEYIRALGTAHGEYLRDRVERERRGRPDGDRRPGRQCWGNMVWRLNDPWPILYWSMIDSYLEPKIPYYFLRRSYTPVLVSFEKTADELFVWVTNDSPAAISGELRVSRRSFAGRPADALPGENVGASIGTLTADVTVVPGESVRVIETAGLGPISLTKEYLEAEFLEQRVTCLLREERYLHLPRIELEVEVEGNRLSIRAPAGYARQIEIDASALEDVIVEDNYFDLSVGESRTVALRGNPRGVVTVSAVNAQPVRIEVG
ncbi:MAG: glycoside hydrolase family 2 protein [Trebonia sp.]